MFARSQDNSTLKSLSNLMSLFVTADIAENPFIQLNSQGKSFILPPST